MTASEQLEHVGEPDPAEDAGTQHPWKRRILRSLLVLLVLILAIVGGFALYIYVLISTAPSLDQLQPKKPGASSRIFAAAGESLGTIPAPSLRIPLKESDFSPSIKQATVAVEDRRFFEHEGLDYQGILRAAVQNIRAGGVVEGGSTLTQQIVKNIYISNERTYHRKIREAKIASELEKQFSKDEILAKYLNNVNYGTHNGQEALGVQAAARLFFGTSVDKLKLHQTALLAGLPQAPDSYNPFRSPKLATERRNQVLEAMRQARYITPTQAAAARAKALGVISRPLQREGYFFEVVRKELVDLYGKERVERGGINVRTTLRIPLQAKARSVIRATLNQSDDPEATVVSINPRTGAIEAMALSTNAKQQQFNYVTEGTRSPGSTFKPFVLAAALEQGVDPFKTTYKSEPIDIDHEEYGPIKVETFDETYPGNLDLQEATIASDNSIYTKLDLDVGPDKVSAMAKKLGITSPLQGVPSEGLGGLRKGVSMLEMAHTYSTFAAGGISREPFAIKRVTFPNGAVKRPERERAKRVISKQVAGLVNLILEKNVAEGTGVAAQIDCAAAGKTGTTDNFTDAWFVGYTPTLATSVWVGYPNANKSMDNVHGIAVSGSTFPASIWGEYMQAAQTKCLDFPRPTNVDLEPLCTKRTSTDKKYCPEARSRESSKNPGGVDIPDTDDEAREENAPSDLVLETTITEQPPPEDDTQARFSFSGNGQSFQCRLDGSAWTACESPVDYSKLDPGEHEFSVRSIAGGSADTSPETVRWEVIAPSDPPPPSNRPGPPGQQDQQTPTARP